MDGMTFTQLKGWLQVSLLATVLSVAALNSGCVVAAAGAAAGAGTVAWVEGKLVVTLDHSYDHVLRASDQAITQLQFMKVSDARDALSAELVSRTAEDKKVRISLKKEGDHLTEVQIRVDTFGDKALSLAVLDRIKANL
jgi:hypothetical protein